MNETGKSDKISLQTKSISTDEKISCLSVQSSDNEGMKRKKAPERFGREWNREVITLES